MSRKIKRSDGPSRGDFAKDGTVPGQQSPNKHEQSRVNKVPSREIRRSEGPSRGDFPEEHTDSGRETPRDTVKNGRPYIHIWASREDGSSHHASEATGQVER